jgi:hypothetical protein
VPPAHYKTFDSHFAKRKTKQMFKTYFSAQTFVTVLLALIAFTVIYQLLFTNSVTIAPATLKDTEGKDVSGYAGVVKMNFDFSNPFQKAA